MVLRDRQSKFLTSLIPPIAVLLFIFLNGSVPIWIRKLTILPKLIVILIESGTMVVPR